VPAQDQQLIYESAGWEVDLARRELRADGIPVAIGGRAFEIIEALIEAAGEVVTKDELMGRVWHGAIVEENTLQVHISAVRKALGADRGMLKTASGRGYRLLGTWTARQSGTPKSLLDRIAASPLPVPSFSSNFLVAASDLIGRDAAVQQVRDLLSAYRAVTLTGPGGIGKTVLAVEAARSLLPTFEGEGWLVELASVADAGLVPTAVAGVLGLKLGGNISAESVARAVSGRKLLLVVDNCEHVIDAAARLVEMIVRLCPGATVLATSREVLRIEGEYVYRVPPLEVPPVQRQEAGHVLGHSAVQLFIARTGALAYDFTPGGEQLATIAAICRHLDGIPLAIELAAARAATLGVPQVAARLEDRFGLLTSGRRTALPRHQTLRATLDWSYELLPEEERRLLRRLAIFPTGFTIEAAEAVGNAGGTASTVAEGIAGLVAKSLLNRDGSAPAGRWRLLETIRSYALDKLAQIGESQEVALSHAGYFRDLIVPADTGSVLRLSIEDVARYGREIDNVRAALDWSFSPAGDVATGVALTAAFAPVWLHFSLLAECRERAEQALGALSPGVVLIVPLELRLHVALAIALLLTMGPVERARTVVAKARTIAERADDVDARLRVLWAQWSIEFTTGECRAAQSTALRFSELARRCGDDAAALVADRLMGNTLQYAGNQRDAQKLLEHVLEHYVAPENRRHTILFHYDQHVLARAMLARVLWLRGSIDRGNDQARASLEEARAADPGFTVCWALHYAVCPLALMTGDIAAADRAVRTMVDLGSSLSAPLWKIMACCWEGKLLIERGEFGEGSDLLRDALATCEQTGWLNSYPEFMGVLAEGLAGLGRTTEALDAIERALASAVSGGERWYEAELLRTKGELLLRQAGDRPVPAAEDCFEKGLAVAREQGALFWELRLALSFARLRKRQERPDVARQILAPVYDRFTEGFETADLAAARAMLASLGSQGVGSGR
jgi:predicted ATPase/DNA-binding winged helix-turn-helix (wHTH) protein